MAYLFLVMSWMACSGNVEVGQDIIALPFPMLTTQIVSILRLSLNLVKLVGLVWEIEAAMYFGPNCNLLKVSFIETAVKQRSVDKRGQIFG